MYCFEKKDSVRLKENYLNMGQTSPSGENIYLNNLYLTKNGKPFCPVMGEAHNRAEGLSVLPCYG